MLLMIIAANEKFMILTNFYCEEQTISSLLLQQQFPFSRFIANKKTCLKLKERNNFYVNVQGSCLQLMFNSFFINNSHKNSIAIV